MEELIRTLTQMGIRVRMKIPHARRNCENCSHSFRHVSFGGSYYEPPDEEAGCSLEYSKSTHPLSEVVSLLLADYYEVFPDCLDEEAFWVATICPAYQEKMVTKCHECGKLINQPENDWELWVSTFGDSVPVCSSSCREKIEQQEEELMRSPSPAEVEEMREARQKIEMARMIDMGLFTPDGEPTKEFYRLSDQSYDQANKR